MAEFQLPAEFKNFKKSAALAALEMEAAGDGVEPSFGVLKIGGKVFSLRFGGRDYPFLRADDGTPQGYVDVCFVRAGTTKAKTYYEGGFKEGSKDRPTCWSNDAVKPDVSVPKKLSDSCLLCPKNTVGSAVTDTGKPAKACSDHKRTAVFIDPPTVAKAGAPAMEAPVMLRIPAASLENFRVYGENLKSQGLNLIDVITRIKFDTDSKFQKFIFNPMRPLTDGEGGVALELRDSATANQIIGAGEGQLLDIERGENEKPAAVYQVRGEGQPMAITHQAAPKTIDVTPEPVKPIVDPEEEELAKMEAAMAAKKAAMAAKKAAVNVVDMRPAEPKKPTTRKPKAAAPADAEDAEDASMMDIPDDLKAEIGALIGAA